MSYRLKFEPLPILFLAVALFAAGCHGNQDQNAANQNPSSDPAAANLAPVSADQTAAVPQSSAPPSDTGAGGPSYQPSDQSSNDSDYGEQPVATAPDPPPPLPEYDQPPAPADDYLWTPGYWDYSSAGYYWVPGVWVQAPYQGALWTPGWWGFRHHHYEFFAGYWGPHIGYYGGVNYGFGYVGTGYQGGYWNRGHFNYNRSVNNVNTTIVHNVYNYNVIKNRNVNRVSFNGGSGGIQVRPRPAELAAVREPHAPPMTAQVQVLHAASTDRSQFLAVNHGRPAAPAISRPLVADRDVRPVVPAPFRTQPAIQQREPGQAHTNTALPERPAPHQVTPQRQPEARSSARPTPPARTEPTRPAPREATPPRPAPARPAPREVAPARREAPPPRPPAAKPAPRPRPEEKEKPKP